ncbi:MAG: methyltetrahydrofolate--corrinoid methyltransferase [Deltaproteobacteria bacterium RBG_13_52_11]|nr:MAG: methyltetrahydrofolate--corrinoid methyltransferase [Deltaproteobacteria bacterium RBG_13_52_11]
MIIIGELINSTRKAIADAIKAGDRATIQKIAKDQAEAGAHYIDVNAGSFQDREIEYLTWLVEAVQEVVELPCCLDSPKPAAIEAALKVHKGIPMVNSISLEKERREKLLPVVIGKDLKVVALCMSDSGMPRTAEDRIRIADELIHLLLDHQVKLENIYVDPLVQPVATDQTFGREFLKSVEQIMSRFPAIHTICGLSNVSFGLPLRKFLNRTFMAMAIAKGLDTAILDPLDKPMMACVLAAEALAGRDKYCMNFIKSYRGGKLEV